jgi:metal-dependent amidase/aminoacylase/carboxypeptidase family protein
MHCRFKRQLGKRFLKFDRVRLGFATLDAYSFSTSVCYKSTIPGVMHACGHDMHTTTLMAAVQMMVNARDRWSGTLIALFQPSEEDGKGALSMLEGGLYTNPGIPT